ncbi:MAG: GntR family transcriptional regulator [bacterium]|nr:GntR family transcriptional regulator [bacterium]
MPLILTIDRHSGTPVYRQIVDQIRFQATSGELAAHSELPSTRALAADHGVNPMTVSKAFAELVREGIVARRLGLPHVIIGSPKAKRDRQRRQELTQVLDPAVKAADQLGLAPEEASALFLKLCKRHQGPKGSRKRCS